MLPPGMTLDPNTGAIGGTPTTPGNYTITISAKDSAEVPFSINLTLTISGAPQFTNTSPLPNGEVGVAYSYQMTASGGTPPYSNYQVTA